MNPPRMATVRTSAELPGALEMLDLPHHVPVIVLIGGAAGMRPDQVDAAQRAIRDAVAPVAAAVGAVVVDGGTDAGVMQFAGEARLEQGDGFTLVGVVARSLVELGVDADGVRVTLEPRHSAIVVVPGERWGDETRWLFDAAQLIASGMPVRTVLVNGGSVTRSELAESLRRSIPVIAIRGTGRAADDLDGNDVLDDADATYDRSLISVADGDDSEGLQSMLREALARDERSGAAGNPIG